jgi:hypothetical protein
MVIEEWRDSERIVGKSEANRRTSLSGVLEGLSGFIGDIDQSS